ncbi:hypothetical protein D3C78_1264890 [compost metagenome]
MMAISTRRFMRRFSGLLFGTSGWESAMPCTTRRLPSKPGTLIIWWATATARWDESSQLDWNSSSSVATSSV